MFAYFHACFPFMASYRSSAIRSNSKISKLSFKKQLLKWAVVCEVQDWH